MTSTEPPIGTIVHFALHPDQYLTRNEAGQLVRKSPRTIRRYIAAGLPLHTIAGTEYIHLAQLREAVKRHHKSRVATRFKATSP